ncbi:hypothetical protein [Aerococcus sp. L_32]|uniref:hypothetical protein n=1 Tax=Aerococcus sp. L_32 TaxID=3422316 RepID=UPI003D6C2197
MTDAQFQRLLDAITGIIVDMPTWLSLILGSLLTILTSIIFSLYESFQNKKFKENQIDSLKMRLNNYLNFLITEKDTALLKKELVLEVACKIEKELESLLSLQNELKLNTDDINKVMINPILIKQYVLIDFNPSFDGLSPSMVRATRDNAKKIKSVISKI